MYFADTGGQEARRPCPVTEKVSRRGVRLGDEFIRSALADLSFLAGRKARGEFEGVGSRRARDARDWIQVRTSSQSLDISRLGIGAPGWNGMRRVNEPAAIKSNAFVVVEDARGSGQCWSATTTPVARP